MSDTVKMTAREWEVCNRLRESIPDILYKFRKYNGNTEKIFLHGGFNFGPMQNMNDKFEMVGDYTEFHEALVTETPAVKTADLIISHVEGFLGEAEGFADTSVQKMERLIDSQKEIYLQLRNVIERMEGDPALKRITIANGQYQEAIDQEKTVKKSIQKSEKMLEFCHSVTELFDTEDKKRRVNYIKKSLPRKVLSSEEREILRRIGKANMDNVLNSFGILSLTTDPYNNYMWESYGEEWSGVAVGIAKEAFDDDLIGKVSYNDEYVKITAEDIEADIIEKVMFHKHNGWAQEKEVRVYRKLEGISHTIDKKFIKEVIVGYRFEEKAGISLETFSKNLREWGVTAKVFLATPDREKQRIVFEEL